MNVDKVGDAWGKHMRAAPNGWHRTNAIARLGEIGSGHSYVRAAYSSDSITSGSQRSHSPTGKKGKLKLAAESWRISGNSPSSDAGDFRKNLADMRINNMRIAKPIILITKFMEEDVLWFHRGWRELSFRHQAMLWTHYVAPVSNDRKYALLQISSQSYETWLEKSQRAVETQIGMLQLNAPTSQPIQQRIKPNKHNVSLWPDRILASIHKFPIRDSVCESALPMAFSPLGKGLHRSPKDFVEDKYCYFRLPDGRLYAVMSVSAVRKLRRRGELQEYLSERKEISGELCHFPEWFDTRLRRKARYNTDNWLRLGGLNHLDECLVQWCKQSREQTKNPWHRRHDGWYPN